MRTGRWSQSQQPTANQRKGVNNLRFGRLREEIHLKFGTLQNFANAVDIKYCSLIRKLSKKTEFTREEIARCCEVLDIPISRIPELFFYD